MFDAAAVQCGTLTLDFQQTVWLAVGHPHETYASQVAVTLPLLRENETRTNMFETRYCVYNVYMYAHFNHHITLNVIINSLVFHHSRSPLIRIMSSGINRTRRAIRAVRKTRMTLATRSTEAPEEIPLPPPLVTASTTGTIQVSKILSDTCRMAMTNMKNIQILMDKI